MLNQIVYLGDEDRAASHTSVAQQLYRLGVPGAQLSDGTTIDISGEVAYINSPMLSEFAVLAPRDVGNGQYMIDFYGYNHRKDAMLPQGRQFYFADYSANGFPTVLGPEIYHFGDGIALLLVTATEDPFPLTRSPIGFIVAFSMMSPVEDIQTQEAGQGTVQGFPSTLSGLQGEGSMLAQGDNFYTASTYGVDRATAYPTFRAVINSLYTGSNSVETQNYNSGNSSVSFKQADSLIVFVTASKNGAVEPAAYSLGVDIIDYTSNGTIISAPFPIAIPLGNNSVVSLGRKRNADSSLIFGGTFSIFATRTFGAASFSQSAVAVTGIISGYFDSNAWSCGPTTQSSYTVPADFLRSFYLFESFARTQRDCVPISQTETLIFGLREMLDSSPDWRASWACFSVTTGGVTVKSSVSTHRGVFSSSTYARKDMKYVGATHDDANGVYVFFQEYAAAVGSGAFVYQGLVRYYSSDNGATWDSGTTVTLDWGNVDQIPPYAYWLSPPKWIATEAGSVKIIMAYTVGESVSGGIKLTRTTMQTSVDGGVTFAMSPVGDPNLNYVLPTGSWLFHTPRGQTSVQEFGNHEDGYAPSPFRHLPTYYGTPTKASRDASNDPGL